ncbi:MAG: T9SS type A sorting domain-containing protein [Cyclobacteriaceae bacterium]
MKPILKILVLLISFSNVQGQVVNSFYIDFGKNDGTNGDVTAGPDSNGNYWNNFLSTISASQIDLIDTADNSSNLYIKVTEPFLSNGRLNGGLLSPDSELLGDFAIGTATEDYYYVEGTNVGSLEIGGLDTEFGYVFKVFATRATGTLRTSRYDFSGENSYTGTLQTSGTGAGISSNGNNNTILETHVLYPDNGAIQMDLSIADGGFAYIGSMKIEQVVRVQNDPEILSSLLFDFGKDDVTNGNATLNPDDYNSYWNNMVLGQIPSNLITLDGSSSSIKVSVGSFSANGIQNGGLLQPEYANLGEYAIPTVTQDYFHTPSHSTLLFKNLALDKGYVFNVFSSRDNTETRKSQYTFRGSNVKVDSLQSSGVDIGTNGYDGNNNTIVSSGVIFPDNEGRIWIDVSVLEGSFAYINAMKLDVVEPVAEYFVDFGPNDGSNGNITSNRDINFNHWNNLNDPLSSSTPVSLVDKYNKWSHVSIEITSDFEMNGINNGGLMSPEVSLLGDFAVNTVTQDYFHTLSNSGFTISGLNPDNQYVFNLFGTRNSTATRRSEYRFEGSNTTIDTLQTSGTDLGGSGYHGNNSTIIVTDTIYPDSNGDIVYGLTVAEGGFAYIGGLKISEYIPLSNLREICYNPNDQLIAVMGSSVPFGIGATNDEGYIYQYTQQLSNRYSNGDGLDWKVSNISIPGNNTTAVLNRWETDLEPLCAKYVIYALSLGNEGVKENGQLAFNQWRDNMLLLIDSARNNGIHPVIANCYARADFTSTQYDFTKQMNLLIHQWDVPSINLLGTIDNGFGQWETGYQNDPSHPNDAGHAEMYLSIVPSLFDALNAGKAQPSKVSGTYLTLVDSLDKQLDFTPDGVVHSFTFSFDIKTSSSGVVGGFALAGGRYGVLSVDEYGYLDYHSSDIASITTDSIQIDDDEWHKISLTHYHARGETLLYIDGNLQGTASETLVPERFFLGSLDGPTSDYREWTFHRSGMTVDEIESLADGDMLKSSLELYAPLDGLEVYSSNVLINLAQSTVEIVQNDAEDLTAPVVLYGDCAYTGNAIELFEGSYDLSSLLTLGYDNDSLSSIEIKSGYTVTLYMHSGFAGSSLEKSVDDFCLDDDGFNDAMSSIIVESNSGSRTVNQIVNVREGNRKVFIYPNPPKDYILIDGLTDRTPFEICDAVGKILLHDELNPKDKIDVNSLKAGIHLLRLHTEQGVITFKLIK